MPAPPPPNPLVVGRKRDAKFYEANNPPPDNAPIADLIEYWTHHSSNNRGPLYFGAKPSDRTVERLAAEMTNNPAVAVKLLSVLPDNKAVADAAKFLYDQTNLEDDSGREQRRALKEWLKFHSPHFSGDLEKVAKTTGDADGYVAISNENNLLALTRHDFEKASPIINQLYGDRTNPVSQALGTWALYRHSMETGSISDTDRYRSELMRMVEDKTLSDGVRDKAYDALTHGPDFPGRAEWSFSLYGDETLVNMPRFTMLTTLIMYSPAEMYVPKMIELVERNSNPLIRSAAVRNLTVALNRGLPPELQRQIVAALLPWLEDPKWASEGRSGNDTRQEIINILQQIEMPESVPGLIKLIDEKETRTVPNYAANSNSAYSGAMANAVNAMANAANAVAYAANMTGNANSSWRRGSTETESYPHRYSAVTALTKQKDQRAVPALKRVMSDGEIYQQMAVVRALIACHGFSTVEQLEALEFTAKGIEVELEGSSNMNANIAFGDNIYSRPKGPLTAEMIRMMIGRELLNSAEIPDALARAIVDRIEILDQKDKPLAAAFRKIILRWQNSVINILLLRDVKRDIAGSEAIVRLLAQRKMLRETQSGDIFDLKTGSQTAVGIATCLLEDTADAAAIMESGSVETKSALLACSRLIRLPLAVPTVAELVKSEVPILAMAAQRYLESEDSPAARSVVLSRHPGEAKILGATTAFFNDDATETTSETLALLFQSLGDNSLYNGWYGSGNDSELKTVEKSLRDEVKKDDDLLGIYAFDKNYVRIYKNRVIFSWDEDESRYRERPLNKLEYDEIRNYISTNKLDEMPPFISCGGAYCAATELLMLGKAGGRRVYSNGEPPEVFAGLSRYFADLKRSPATLKYSLSREIPGLEIIFSSDELHAETVWHDAGQLRMAASEAAVRKRVKSEIEATVFAARVSESEDEEAEPETNVEGGLSAQFVKRQFEGFAWYRIAGGALDGVAAQPADAGFIPVRDGLAVQSSGDEWKARSAGLEIRTSEEGIFKLARGKLTKLREGFYSDAVITPNGRWIVAHKSNDEGSSSVVRIDLVTNKEYPVAIEGYGEFLPTAFVPTLNKVLAIRDNGGYHSESYEHTYGEDSDRTARDPEPDSMILIDPATGATQPVAGEFRPLSQQSFRPLQKTGIANEFWAAIADHEKNETQIGIYDIKTFGFKPVLKIPKIIFNSMDMWVNEAGAKVYFVYRGHVLALPLTK